MLLRSVRCVLRRQSFDGCNGVFLDEQRGRLESEAR